MSFMRMLRVVGSAVVAGALFLGTAPVASADQIRDDQWALQAFSVDKVWSESTGKGVTVAVIDSGVDGTHPDLKGNVLPGKDFVNGGTADREKENDHGTAMASLIAGHGHGAGNSEGVMGLAPDAKILPIKHLVRDDFDSGNSNDYAEALRYAVDEGASVVNMSFDTGIAISSDEEKAIAYAAEKDVLLVGGAGNDSADRVSYPAGAPGVVAVGATDKDGLVWEDSNSGPQLVLTAPGVYIRSASAGGGYHLANGTSDATAYVSAAAALLRSKFPDLTAGQIANRLVKTAGLPPSKEGASLPDPHYGYGFIRPYRALTEDIPVGSKNGPLKTPTAAGSPTPSTTAIATGGDDSSSSLFSRIGLTGTLIAAAVAIGLIVLVIVLSSRSSRRRVPVGAPPYAQNGFPQQPPQGYPPHPGQAPPSQQGPYTQQPPGQWPHQ